MIAKYAGLLWLAAVGASAAPTPMPADGGGQATVGDVHIQWRGVSRGDTTHTHLIGDVRVASPRYDLSGEEITLRYAQPLGGGATTISEAVAEGDAAHGVQVVGHFRDDLNARLYTVHADHTVYAADPSRPNGATVTCTGRAVLRIRANDALAEPATMRSEKIIVRLGDGPDYPQYETAAGTADLTPGR